MAALSTNRWKFDLEVSKRVPSKLDKYRVAQPYLLWCLSKASRRESSCVIPWTPATASWASLEFLPQLWSFAASFTFLDLRDQGFFPRAALDATDATQASEWRSFVTDGTENTCVLCDGGLEYVAKWRCGHAAHPTCVNLTMASDFKPLQMACPVCLAPSSQTFRDDVKEAGLEYNIVAQHKMIGLLQMQTFDPEPLARFLRYLELNLLDKVDFYDLRATEASMQETDSMIQLKLRR